MALVLFLGLPVSQAHAQNLRSGERKAAPQARYMIDSLIGNLAETLPESETGHYDLSEIGDRLAWHLRHPLDLNRASFEELHALFMLNDLQISSLLDHIRLAGPLADILELQSVRNFDLATVRRLLPFVTVAPETVTSPFSLNTILKDPEHEIRVYHSRVLAKQKGYARQDESRLPGGPGRWYVRYQYRSGDYFSLNLLAEKDPGEAFLSSKPRKGFDFYSGNIYIRPEGRLKKLVIGDYLLQFGQGLNVWNGFSLGKGPAALNIGRQAQGIKPHNSSGESYFFRGAAGSFSLGKLEVSPFISRRELDGTVAESDRGPAISSIRRSGLHRNKGELAAKGSLTEITGGANLKYRFSKQFSIGFTVSHVSFDKPLLPGEDLYERYDLSGKKLTLISLDYSFGRANFILFGEIARSLGAGWAFINGILISPAEGITLAASYRSFGKNYQNLYASPLSESSNIAGEKGIYIGAEARFSDAWTLTAYADSFSWSWLRYRTDAPSQGYELSARLVFRPVKKFTLYGSYRKTVKPRNLKVPENSLHILSFNAQRTTRLHSEYRVNRRLRFRCRAEHVVYRMENAKKTGFSIFQDISWDPGKIGFDARFTYFSTDDYDTRIYSYESNVLHSATLAFYYDKGFKTYLGVRWKASGRLNFWLRYGLLRYVNRESIGSGPDEIQGRGKPDIRLQLRLQL